MSETAPSELAQEEKSVSPEAAAGELAQEEKQMLLAALEEVRRGGHHAKGAEGHEGGAEGGAEEGGWFDVTKLDAAQRDQVLAAAGYAPAGEAAAAASSSSSSSSSSRAKLGADRATWSPLVSALVQRWQRAALVRARFQKGGRLAGRLGLAVSGMSQAPRVWVCGRNNHGQLGLGVDAPPEESGLKNELKPMRKLPVPLPPFAGVPIAHVACGAAHTVVASANHTVFAFGFNAHGELGLGHTTPAMVRGANMAPVPVPALEGVRVASLVCGPHFTLLATREPRDELLGWGQNDAGQLGLGPARGHSDDVPRPAPIPGLSGRRVRSMSCGEKHSVVVVERRAAAAAAAVGRGGGRGVAKQATTQLFAFGGNTYGQLGLEGRTGRRTPTAVPESLFAFEGRTAETTLCITHVAAGANFTMAALRAETPVVVADAEAGAGAAEQVRAELGVGARVERSAHVYGWGDNQFRQLALAPDADGLDSATAAVRSARRLGDPTHVDRPARSSALSGREVSSLACGAAHTLLVTAGTPHEVWGAGGNVHGSMGGGRKVVRGIVRGAPRDPGTARRDEASVVRKLCSSAAGLPDGMVTATGLETVCAGAFHCVGTAGGGAGHVYSWGKNTEGQLGLGNNYARYQPGPQYVQGLPADTKVLRAASMCCATEHTVLFVPFREAKPRAPEPRALKQAAVMLRIVPEFKDVLEQPKRRQEAKPAVDFEPAAAAREGDGRGAAGATGAEETAGPEPMPAAPEPVAPKAKEKKPLSVIEIKLAGARAKAEAAAKGMNEAQTAALVAERTGAPAPAPAPANVPEGDEFGALDGHDGVFFSPATQK